MSHRLQLLQEREARQGINTDYAVIVEIEDIEAELEARQAELGKAIPAPTRATTTRTESFLGLVLDRSTAFIQFRGVSAGCCIDL